MRKQSIRILAHTFVIMLTIGLASAFAAQHPADEAPGKSKPQSGKHSLQQRNAAAKNLKKSLNGKNQDKKAPAETASQKANN